MTAYLRRIRLNGSWDHYVKCGDRSGRSTWIFFDPSYSGQGLGRQSVAHCLKVLAEDKRVDKFVVTTSQFAFGFFEKFGYDTIRTEKNYWGKGLDSYVMEMPNRLDR